MATDETRIREGVRRAYSAAADCPGGEHAFPVGRAFAEECGYPPEELDSLPPMAVDAFAGVSAVSVFAELEPGMDVVDLGCGAGLDSLIAARKVAPGGSVVGVDFSESMLVRARQAAERAAVSGVEFVSAAAESLPLAANRFDVALVNGIFNLNPDRSAVFAELARILRPGGAVYAAELILREPLPPGFTASSANWFS